MYINSAVALLGVSTESSASFETAPGEEKHVVFSKLTSALKPLGDKHHCLASHQRLVACSLGGVQVIERVERLHRLCC